MNTLLNSVVASLGDLLLEQVIHNVTPAVLGPAHKRKLKSLIADSISETYLFLKSEAPNKNGTNYEQLFISYIEKIHKLNVRSFAQFIIKQDESAIKNLLTELNLINTKDDELCWVAECVKYFSILLTSKIINEASNYDSPLYNMVQIMNIDIIKYRLDSLLKSATLISSKMDDLLRLIKPDSSYDFSMSYCTIIGSINSTPPEIIIENFLNTYVSHDDIIVAYGGRASYTNELNCWMNNPESNKYALLVSEAGRGKSALMAHWFKSIVNLNCWHVIFVPVSTRAKFNTKDDIYPFLLDQLIKVYNNCSDEKYHLADSITTIYSQQQIGAILARLSVKNIKTLIILDGLDEAAEGVNIGHFIKTINFELNKESSNNGELSSIKIIFTARKDNNLNTIESWAGNIGLEQYYPLPELPLLDNKDIEDILKKTKDPLNKLKNQEIIAVELQRLSKGEPLLVKLYIDELLQIRSARENAFSIDTLKDIEPGFAGYLNQYLKEDVGTDTKRVDHISILLFLLAYTYMPISSDELKQLYIKIVNSTDDFEAMLKIVRKLTYRQDNKYSFCHQAISIFLRNCNTLVIGNIDVVKKRNRAYLSYLEWLKDCFASLDGSAFKYEKFPDYLKEKAIEHIVEYANTNPFKDGFDYYSIFTSEKWLRLFYYRDGHYYNYKKYISACYDHYLSKVSFTNPNSNLVEFIKSLIIISILNDRPSQIPAELYAEILKEKDDSKRVLKEHQIINNIAMIVSDEEKYNYISKTVEYYSEPGLDVITLIAIQIKDSYYRCLSFIKIAEETEGEASKRLLIQTLEATAKINDSTKKIEIILHVSRARKGDKFLLQQALDISMTIDNLEEKSNALINIVESAQEDKSIFQQALDINVTISALREKIKVILSVVQAKKRDKILLQQALDISTKINPESSKAETLITIVELSQGDNSLLQQVLNIVDITDDLNEKIKVITSVAQARKGDKVLLQKALNISTKIKYESSKAEALITIVELSQGDNSLLQQVLNIAATMDDSSKKVKVVASVAQARKGDKVLFQQALDISTKINSEFSKAEALITIVELSQEDNPLLQQVLNIAATMDDSIEKVKVVASVAQARKGDKLLLQQALNISTKIEYESSKAEALITIVELSQGDNSLLQQVLNIVDIMDDLSEKIKVITSVAQARKGDKVLLQQALNISTKIKYESSKAEALITIVELSQGDNSLLQQTLNIAAMMDNLDEKSKLVASVVQAKKCDNRLLQQALDISITIDVSDLKVAAITAIIKLKHENSKLLEQAIDIAKTINNSTSKVKALITIMKEKSESKNVLHKLLNISMTINSLKEKSNMVVAIVQSARGDKDILHLALKIATTITDEFSRDDVICYILESAQGDKDILRQALRITGATYSSQDYAITLIARQIKGDKILLQQVLDIYMKMDNFKKGPQALIAIVESASGDKGILQQALNIADCMEDLSGKVEAIASVAQAGKGDKLLLQQALDISTKIKHESSKAAALIAIVESARGDKDILQQVLNIADCMDDLNEKIKVIASVARARKGDKVLLQKAFDIVTKISDGFFKVVGLIDMLDAAQADTQEILNMAVILDDSAEKVSFLASVAYAKKGYKLLLQQALNISTKINSEFSKAEALIAIVEFARGDTNILHQTLYLASIMDDSNEKVKVIKSIMQKKRGNKLLLQQALDISTKIISEFSKAEALIAIVESAKGDKDILQQALDIAVKMDFHIGELLSSVVRAGKGDKSLTKQILDIVGNPDFAYDSREIISVMVSIAEATNGDKPLLQQALDISTKIIYESSKAAVLIAIVESAQGDKDILQQTLKIAVMMTETREKDNILLHLLDNSEYKMWTDVLLNLKLTISLDTCSTIIPLLLSQLTDEGRFIVELSKSIQEVPQWFNHTMHVSNE